jgi:hypothetical protein
MWGTANFHSVILVDPGNPAEMEEAERLNQRVMRRALAMDGTCTGEHGVGMHKISLLSEVGDPAVDLMRRLKAAWDPLICSADSRADAGEGPPPPQTNRAARHQITLGSAPWPALRLNPGKIVSG